MDIKRIREFAEGQFFGTEAEPVVGVYDERTGQCVTNPWIDSSGRFPLTDGEAKAYWGKTYDAFCEAVGRLLGHTAGKQSITHHLVTK